MLDFIKKIFGGGSGASYTSLSGREVQERIKNNKKVVVLDVRSKGEYASGKIRGAMNIDVQRPDFDQKINGLDKDKTYYVYCRSGMRSSRACKKMVNNGFEHVYNMKGGIMAWPGKLS